jgi:hypothetical protein
MSELSKLRHSEERLVKSEIKKLKQLLRDPAFQHDVNTILDLLTNGTFEGVMRGILGAKGIDVSDKTVTAINGAAAVLKEIIGDPSKLDAEALLLVHNELADPDTKAKMIKFGTANNLDPVTAELIATEAITFVETKLAAA